MELPTSIETLLIFVALVAPGLLFEQGIERSRPYWRTNIRERVIRFLMWSIAWQLLLLPVHLAEWRWYESRPSTDPGLSVYAATWLIAVAVLIVLPFGAGAWLG